MGRIVECLKREDFEIKLCEAINNQCETNFKPLDCEKVKGIFIIQENYNGDRFQRFSNFGQPCKFGPRALKDTITVCLQAVKARKERNDG